jgi:hypothetical protein
MADQKHRVQFYGFAVNPIRRVAIRSSEHGIGKTWRTVDLAADSSWATCAGLSVMGSLILNCWLSQGG